MSSLSPQPALSILELELIKEGHMPGFQWNNTKKNMKDQTSISFPKSTRPGEMFANENYLNENQDTEYKKEQ